MFRSTYVSTFLQNSPANYITHCSMQLTYFSRNLNRLSAIITGLKEEWFLFLINGIVNLGLITISMQ